MRLGDLDALKEYAKNILVGESINTVLGINLYKIFEEIIDNAPTVDISGNEYFPYRTAYFNGVKDGRATARPQGEWKALGFVHSRRYAWCTCSNCGKTTKIYLDKDNDFCCIADIRNKAVACLFCGADMRGKEE